MDNTEFELDPEFIETIELMRRSEELMLRAFSEWSKAIARQIDVEMTVPKEFIKAFDYE